MQHLSFLKNRLNCAFRVCAVRRMKDNNNQPVCIRFAHYLSEVGKYKQRFFFLVGGVSKFFLVI